MSYSHFKTIEDVKSRFNVQIESNAALFSEVIPCAPSPLLSETLANNIPLALNINTKKARSELIIAPVLVEIRNKLQKQVSLFSGVEFNVDETLQLSGYCDFILSRSPDQIFVEVPIVCVVEAKNENIKTAYAQCIAEMIAARMFNEKKGLVGQTILGVITTGSNWKFLRYIDDRILIDYEEYLISQIDKILGIFVANL